MMKLWSSTTSPFARKARIVVIEKNLNGEVEELAIKTNALNSHPELKASNPLAKIPCLTMNNGHSIFDSRVICRYLDDKGEGAILHPSRNFKHETLMSIGDGMIDAGALMFYEELLRPEDKRFAPWVDAQWGKITASLEFVDKEFMDILAHMNMASITIVCALEYLDFRFDERNWRKHSEKLANWHENVKDRQSYVDTRPFVA